MSILSSAMPLLSVPHMLCIQAGSCKSLASLTPVGELFFGFMEENGNKAGNVGGRFINSTLTKGQTIIVPQGRCPDVAGTSTFNLRRQQPLILRITLSFTMM